MGNQNYAGVVELVDTPDLGSDAVRHAGSTPVTRTKCPADVTVTVSASSPEFSQFDSGAGHHRPLAQRLELPTLNRLIGVQFSGGLPIYSGSSVVEPLSFKSQVGGSNPSRSSNFEQMAE